MGSGIYTLYNYLLYIKIKSPHYNRLVNQTYIIKSGWESPKLGPWQDVGAPRDGAYIQGQDHITPIILCLQEHGELWLRVISPDLLQNTTLSFLCVTLREIQFTYCDLILPAWISTFVLTLRISSKFYFTDSPNPVGVKNTTKLIKILTAIKWLKYYKYSLPRSFWLLVAIHLLLS